MSKRWLLIGSLLCAMLFATTGSVLAQKNLRPEKTLFIKPRVGISSYFGDNEKSPTNFNFDMYKIDGKVPYNVALELGYQVSIPLSVSLGYQLGNYPIITQFGEEEGSEQGINDDDAIRHSVQLFGRYTFTKDATKKVAFYVPFGLNVSFGKVTQFPRGTQPDKDETAFGPLLGLGLDIAINDRSSFFVEGVSSMTLPDEAIDGNKDNGAGGMDHLLALGLGLKVNFKRAFTPVEIGQLTCPEQLTVGETGNFSAVTNDDYASQPVEYRWDFGDGNVGTGLGTTHSFASGGTYTVNFTATNSGSTDSRPCTVTVAQPAEVVTITASNTTTDVCAETGPITFSANVRGDAPLSYRWDFGDGNTSNDANPSHKYMTEGVYSVTLTVSNSAGSDQRTMNVTVGPCESFCTQITELNTVFFDRNSSVLTADGRSALQENLEILQQCANLNVRIEGYASRDERNPQRLSEDRARAVEQFYVDNGIAASRLTSVGMGAAGQTTKKGGASQFRRADSIPLQN